MKHIEVEGERICAPLAIVPSGPILGKAIEMVMAAHRDGESCPPECLELGENLAAAKEAATLCAAFHEAFIEGNASMNPTHLAEVITSFVKTVMLAGLVAAQMEADGVRLYQPDQFTDIAATDEDRFRAAVREVFRALDADIEEKIQISGVPSPGGAKDTHEISNHELVPNMERWNDALSTSPDSARLSGSLFATVQHPHNRAEPVRLMAAFQATNVLMLEAGFRIGAACAQPPK